MRWLWEAVPAGTRHQSAYLCDNSTTSGSGTRLRRQRVEHSSYDCGMFFEDDAMTRTRTRCVCVLCVCVYLGRWPSGRDSGLQVQRPGFNSRRGHFSNEMGSNLECGVGLATWPTRDLVKVGEDQRACGGGAGSFVKFLGMFSKDETNKFVNL